MRRSVLTLCLLVAAFLNSGCWDRMEMGERLYAVSAGVDLFDEQTPARDVHRATGKYRLAVEIMAWEAMGGGEAGAGPSAAGLAPPKPSWLAVSTGDTLARIAEQYLKRSYRPLSWAHLKVIVVGEEAARKEFTTVLEYFTRQWETQRRIKLAIAEGEAKKVLEAYPVFDKIVGITLPRLIGSVKEDNRSLDMTIGDAVTHMDPEKGFLIPRVRVADDGLVVAGLAAFRGRTLVGWLGETETKGATILLNQAFGGVVEFEPGPGKPKGAMRIRRARTRWKVRVAGKVVTFSANISLAGDLDESHGEELTEEKVAAVEAAVAQEVRTEALAAIRATKRLRADLLRLGGLVESRYPHPWEEHFRKHWNDTYADRVSVKVTSVKVTIHQIGLTR